MGNGILHTHYTAYPGGQMTLGRTLAECEQLALAEFERHFGLDIIGAVLRWEGVTLHVEAWLVKPNALQSELRDHLRTDRTLREIAAEMTDHDREVDRG